MSSKLATRSTIAPAAEATATTRRPARTEADRAAEKAEREKRKAKLLVEHWPG